MAVASSTVLCFTTSAKEEHDEVLPRATSRVLCGADRERKLGWRGNWGGGTPSAFAETAWAAPPSHNATLPIIPLNSDSTGLTLGQS